MKRIAFIVIAIAIAALASCKEPRFTVKTYSILYGYENIKIDYWPLQGDTIRVSNGYAYPMDCDCVSHLTIVQEQ